MRKLVWILLSFSALIWADTTSCPGLQQWATQSVKLYQYQGADTASIALKSTDNSGSLANVAPLADFLAYSMLDSFATDCQWKSYTTHFHTHRANSGITNWTTVDSTLWIRHFDDRTLGAAPDTWFWFLPDTTRWDTAKVSSNSYLFSGSVTRWYAFTVRFDTLKTSGSTTISQSGYSRIRLDSASAMNKLLASFSAEVGGHLYDYRIQLVGITYGEPQAPTSLTNASQTPSWHILQQGNQWRVVDASASLWSLYNLQGQQIFTIKAQQNFSLPQAGIYLIRNGNGQQKVLIQR